DRHFGVGADGLILILPATNGQADVRMQMFNADGSEAEMCGNGIRCVAKYAHDHALTTARPMRIETGSGVLSVDFTTDPQDRLLTATVDMGPAVTDPEKVPVDLNRVRPGSDKHTFDLKVGASTWTMTAVSMGNPHVVIYVDELTDQHLVHGAAVETHPAFPNRINVHFVQVNGPSEVTVKHWERGSGPTLACGTGACAVCVAGVLTERTGRDLRAHLPGGDLELTWRPDGHVLMTGSATEVFEGQWPTD
ncbi:MAG: diaminopimelate epimerase, partial [Phycisphaeraceae bacterium]|nr:diaminopimelate epimerase [Phycisphaeraceae bacterium]